jgi:DNA polymerase-3 subunit beta
MKLTVQRGEFAAALGHVTRVVEARNTIPILAHVALEARDDRIVLRATDLDIEARAELPARIAIAGALTIEGRRLHDIVGKLADGALDIEGTSEGGSATLRAGRSRFSLPTLDTADFPDLSAGEMPIGFDLPAATLSALLNAGAFAISTDETRYYLNGVYLHPAGDRLVAVATDGHRLARCSCPLPAGAEAMTPLLIPRKTCAELGRGAKGETTARLEASDSKVRVVLGDRRLTSKLIDGTFPDYGRVIPTDAAVTVTVRREQLAAALGRVRSVADERGRAVRCAVAGAELALSMVQETGQAEDAVPVESDGEIVIGLNGDYLETALSSLPGERVTLAMTDPGSPAVLRPAESIDDPLRLVVIMPMRV